MYKTLITISSLLLSIAILLIGNGLLTTLLALRAELEGIQSGVIGFIMSMYFTGFIAGTFLCPGIIRRVGHIRAFAVFAAIASVTTILHGLWVDPYVWSFMRFFSGICLVGIYMIVESWLNEQSTNQIRGRVIATYMLVMLIALALGQFLILADDVSELTLFSISAGMFSLGLVPVCLTRVHEPAPIKQIKPDLVELFRVSSLGFSGSLSAGLLAGGFWSLGPLFAGQEGATQSDIAIFMCATILGGAILQYPIGILSDHTDRRKILAIISLISAIAALITMYIPVDQPYLLAISMFLFGGMMFSIYPVSIAHANDHPDSTDIVATSSNLLLVNGIGAAIGPVIGGLLMQFFGRYSLLVMFMLIGITLSFCALYWRRYGMEISDEYKTTFVPISRTTQVVMEGIASENTPESGNEN